MRKSIKILTLLLTVALLCGAFAVAISAAVTKTNNLTLTDSNGKIYQYNKEDFEGSISGNAIQVANQNASVNTQNGNKYYSLSQTKLDSIDIINAGSGLYFGPYLGRSQNKTPMGQNDSLLFNDIVVFDFDITADQYVKADGTLTTSKEEAVSASYVSTTATLYLRVRVGGSQLCNLGVSPFKIHTDGTKENGLQNWYLGTHKLPSEAGVWTHVTLVVDIDNTVNYTDENGETKTAPYSSDIADKITSVNVGNSKLYFYANGTLVSSTNLFTDANLSKVTNAASYKNKETLTTTVEGTTYYNYEGLGIDSFRFNPQYTPGTTNWTTGYSCGDRDYSFGIDNITTHYYAQGYSGDITEYLEANYRNTPLYTNSDVVYSGNYLSPNGAIATIGNTGYSIQYGLENAVTNGCTVNLNTDILNFNPIAPCTVVHNGHSFSLADDSDYIVAIKDANTYEVRMPTADDFATVNWHLKDGSVKTTKVLAYTVPTFEGNAGVEEGRIYYQVAGWATTEGATAPEVLNRVYANETIDLYAVYEQKTLGAYGIFDQYGKLLNTSDTPEDVFAQFDSLKSTVSYLKIKLYEDLDFWKLRIADDSTVTQVYNKKFAFNRSDFTLDFDLNGKRAVLGAELNNYGKPMFEISDNVNGSKLNIYSSKENGEIVNISIYRNSNNNKDAIYGGSVVSVRRANVEVTFGNGTNNMLVNAAALIDATGTVDIAKANDSNLVKCNINGGTYVAAAPYSNGFIIIRDDVEFDIKDATIINKGRDFLICRDDRYHGSATGTINNCVIAGPGLFQKIDGFYDFVITNSYLLGTLNAYANTEAGKITLGSGVKTNFDPESYANIIFEDGHYAAKQTAENKTVEYKSYAFAILTTTNPIIVDPTTYTRDALKSFYLPYNVEYATDVIPSDEGLAFTIKDENGNLIRGEDGTYNLYKDAANLKDMLTYVQKKGISIRVKLYADATIQGYTAYVVPEGKTFELDLNGKTLTLFNGDYAPLVKATTDGCSIYIYSSTPGAVLNRFDKTNNKTFAIVSIDDCTSSVKFGNGTQNLTVYTHVLIMASKAKDATETSDVITAEIDGGTYVRADAVSSGLIFIRNYLEMSVKNATMVSVGNPIFYTDTATNAVAKLKLTVYNSTLVNTYTSNPLIANDLQKSSTISITNSTIAGRITFKSEDTTSKVTLGDGVKFATGIAIGGQICTVSNAEIFSNYETKQFTLTHNISDESNNLSETTLNRTYTYSYIEAVPENTIAKVDGVYYTTIEGILDAIKEKSEIKLYQDINEVFHVTMSLTVNKNGHTFNYTVADNIKANENGDTVIFGQYYTVVWHIGDATVVEVYEEGTVPAKAYSALIATVGRENFKVLGWSLTDGGETVSPEAITKDTDYYAVKGDKIYAQIIDANGKVTFTATDLATALTKLCSLTNNYTFKLMADVVITGKASSVSETAKYQALIGSNGSVTKGETYKDNTYSETNAYFDVNGYTWIATPNEGNYVFNLRKHANIYIYSSRPGAEIINTSSTMPLIRMTMENTDLHIGAYGDYSGDNLSIYTNQFIDVAGGSGEIYIDGGYYYATGQAGTSFICNNLTAAAVDYSKTGTSRVNMNLRNGKFIAENQNYLFGPNTANASATKAVWTLTVDNCTLYAKESMFSTLPANCEVSITDSYILAPVTNVSGTITSLDGSKIVAGSTIPAIENETLVNTREDLKITIKTLDASTLTKSTKSAFFSFTNAVVSSSDDYSTITWVYLGESVVEYWLNGSTPVSPFTNIPAATNIYKFSTVNITPANGDKTYEIKQRANFTIFMNLTLYSDFVYNVYIPKDIYDGEYIQTVTVNGTEITIDTDTVVTVSGKDYYIASFDITARNGASKYSFVMNILGYENNTFNSTYSFSIPSYANQVLSGDFDETTKTLMNGTLGYIQSVLNYTNYTGDAIGTVASVPETFTGVAQGTIPSEVSAVISGAQLNLSESIKFRFNFKASGTVTFKYYVKANGYITETVTAKAGEYHEIALRASDLLKNITITVGGKNCTYGLMNYAYFVQNDEAYKTNTKLHELVYNMYLYADAASKYVYTEPTNTISVDGTSIADFTIVATNAREQSAGEMLRDAIYKLTGVMLNVMGSAPEGSHAIRFVKSTSDEKFDFAIRVEEGAIIIYNALDSFLDTAMNKFTAEYLTTLSGETVWAEGATLASYYATGVYYSDFAGATTKSCSASCSPNCAFDTVYAAHEYANTRTNISGYTVVADAGVYDMGVHTVSVKIKTDTDWTDATFIFDDTSFTSSDDAGFRVPIFQVAYTNDNNGTEYHNVGAVAPGATSLNFAPGRRVMVILKDGTDGVRQWFRYNHTSSEVRHEVLIVNADGTIDPSTPVQYDYGTNGNTAIGDKFDSKQVHVAVYDIDETPITIKGGKVINYEVASDIPSYCTRYILVQRSNVTFDGIVHTVKESNVDVGCYYNAFIFVNTCNNVTLRDCVFTGRRYFGQGTYDINASNCNALTLKNCTQTNLGFDANGNYVSEIFNDDGSIISGVTAIQANTEYTIGGQTRKFWGIMGSNYSRNIKYDGCKLSRYDAHAGVYNADIINTDISMMISVTGGGTLNIENSRIHGNYLVQFRPDYGATWHGDVNIKNTVFNSRTSTAYLFYTKWYEHDFGYQCYLPTNITIDGLTLKGTSTAYLFQSETNEWTKDMWTNATNSYIAPSTITVKNSSGTYYVARYKGFLGFIGGVAQADHFFGGTTFSGVSWNAVS